MAKPTELNRFFSDPETDPRSLPSIVEWGTEFVPFTSVRISPGLAAHRKALGTFSEKACTPGLHVTYRAVNSMGVQALGRLR